MKRVSLASMIVLLMVLLLPFTAAAFWPFDDEEAEEQMPDIGSVPAAAAELGHIMDVQLANYLGQCEYPARGVSLVITTPVDLRTLESASPLARQMSEEMAAWFVGAGYAVQEIRLAKSIMIKPDTGELFLTRDTNLMASHKVTAGAVLAGTYTITSKSVRFNMQLIHSGTNTVLAKGSVTIPVTRELQPLLVDLSPYIQTSSGTRLGN